MATKSVQNLPWLEAGVCAKNQNVKNCGLKKPITFQILPRRENTVIFYEKLSVPFGRGYIFGLGTQFSASVTQRLKNAMIATEYRENRIIGVNRPFSIGCC